MNYFLHHSNSDIQQLCISFVLKNMKSVKNGKIFIRYLLGTKTKNLEVTIEKSVLSLKQAFIKNEIKKINELIINEEDPPIKTMKKLTAKLNKALVLINKLLGRNFN